LFNAVDINDADSTMMSRAVVQITGNYQNDGVGRDILRWTDSANITGSWDATTGTLTLTGNASIAEYEQVLTSVGFEHLVPGSGDDLGQNPHENNRTVSILLYDEDDHESNESTMDFFVDAANDSPEFTPVSQEFDFVAGDPSLNIGAAFQLSDIDDAYLEGLHVQITSGYVQGEDYLTLPAGFALPDGVTMEAFDEATGVLSFSGQATIAEYQRLVQAISYENNAPIITEQMRQINLTVADQNSRGFGDAICEQEPTTGGGYVLIDVGDVIGPGPGPEIPDHPVTPEEPPEVPPYTPDITIPEGFGPPDIGRDPVTFPGETGIDWAPAAPLEGMRSWPSGYRAENICTLEESLDLGCRFANAEDLELQFGSYHWEDLGWTPPYLDEEYDLYNQLFLRGQGDNGFNVPPNALEESYGPDGEVPGLLARQVFADRGEENFNGIEAGALKEAFFAGRKNLDVPIEQYRQLMYRMRYGG
jgi:hypothetical protein